MQSPTGPLHCHHCVLIRLFVLHRSQRKADAAKKTQKWQQKREENETEAEKCVQSSAGSLHYHHCVLTRLYVLHRSQRNTDAAKKRQEQQQNNTLKKSFEMKKRGGLGGLAPPVLVDMADCPIKTSVDIM